MPIVAPHHRSIDLLYTPRQTKLREGFGIAALHGAAHVHIVLVPHEEHYATIGPFVDGVDVCQALPEAVNPGGVPGGQTVLSYPPEVLESRFVD